MITANFPISFNGYTIKRADLLPSQGSSLGSDVFIARKILDGDDYEIANQRYDNIPDYLPSGKYIAMGWADYFVEDY